MIDQDGIPSEVTDAPVLEASGSPRTGRVTK